MTLVEDETTGTRKSLLSRLKKPVDQDGWEEFFQTYQRLIRSTARQSGLTEAEAEDVLQQTMLSVHRSITRFSYDPLRGSFRRWLVRLTRWRVIDHVRKEARHRNAEGIEVDDLMGHSGEDAVEELDEVEWKTLLMATASQRLKQRVKTLHYQIFDLLVFQGESASTVSEVFDVPLSQVYLIRHRLLRRLRKEIRKAEPELQKCTAHS